jgi:hypothetical protein
MLAREHGDSARSVSRPSEGDGATTPIADRQSSHFPRCPTWIAVVAEFLHADMQAGATPFLGVFLLAHGWQSGLIGSDQAFNHAGNMTGAGLSGLLGWQFGFAAVFWLTALFVHS